MRDNGSPPSSNLVSFLNDCSSKVPSISRANCNSDVSQTISRPLTLNSATNISSREKAYLDQDPSEFNRKIQHFDCDLVPVLQNFKALTSASPSSKNWINKETCIDVDSLTSRSHEESTFSAKISPNFKTKNDTFVSRQNLKDSSHVIQLMSGYSSFNSEDCPASFIFNHASSLPRQAKGVSLYTGLSIPHKEESSVQLVSSDSQGDLIEVSIADYSEEISETLESTTSLSNSDCGSIVVSEKPPRPIAPSTAEFSVIKIRNISWDLSLNDVVAFFSPIEIASGHTPPFYTQAVHIVMNRETGKTYSECFVEFENQQIAQKVLDMRPKGLLKGRLVNVQMSSQEELLRVLFPRWKVFAPVSENSQNPQEPTLAEMDKYEASTGVVYGGTLGKWAKDGTMLTREEISAILLTCRYYKLHFSRKCAERPFENIISILCKIPWQVTDAVSTVHRDHIFEMLK
ncbi:hypothetical protein HK096_004993, partial [Nowakowskiella sp. JEL0078]